MLLWLKINTLWVKKRKSSSECMEKKARRKKGGNPLVWKSEANYFVFYLAWHLCSSWQIMFHFVEHPGFSRLTRAHSETFDLYSHPKLSLCLGNQGLYSSTLALGVCGLLLCQSLPGECCRAISCPIGRIPPHRVQVWYCVWNQMVGGGVGGGREGGRGEGGVCPITWLLMSKQWVTTVE